MTCVGSLRSSTTDRLPLRRAKEVALPLHPVYRTMPMVWYIPPFSPVVDAVRETGVDAEQADTLFAAIESLRIPVGYLAELFSAGDPETDVSGAAAARRDAQLHA